MELQNVRRLAVFKMRNIGDVLMITPVLRALHETFPHAKISVIVNSSTEAMLANNPHIDEVLVYRRNDGTRGAIRRVWDELKFAFALRSRRFDVTIGFTEGDRTGWYSWFCGAPHRFGILKNKKASSAAYNHRMHQKGSSVHEVEKHFQLLANVEFPLRGTENKNLCLVVPEELRVWAREQLAPLHSAQVVHVHPVSRWLWKCWDSEKMAQVIDWLQTERLVRVVVTTGPANRERELALKIVGLCKTRPLFFDGDLSLEQIAAISAESSGYFGVDTAPMHMAAAVGVPVVALFGPTDPRNWGPWTPLAQVLSKHCVCNDPNSGEKCDWNKTRACLAAITVAEAQAALDQLLSQIKLDPRSLV